MRYWDLKNWSTNGTDINYSKTRTIVSSLVRYDGLILRLASAWAKIGGKSSGVGIIPRQTLAPSRTWLQSAELLWAVTNWVQLSGVLSVTPGAFVSPSLQDVSRKTGDSGGRKPVRLDDKMRHSWRQWPVQDRPGVSRPWSPLLPDIKVRVSSLSTRWRGHNYTWRARGGLINTCSEWSSEAEMPRCQDAE